MFLLLGVVLQWERYHALTRHALKDKPEKVRLIPESLLDRPLPNFKHKVGQTSAAAVAATSAAAAAAERR